MAKKEEQYLLTLMKEIKTLIDKCLRHKLNLSDYTVPQTMIIYNLAHHGNMKISDLSEKMGLTNSTVSGIVDRLEDQGVVTRQRSTKDRRVVYVELTPEHRKKHQDIYNNLDKYFTDILADIPPSELESIIKSLNLLKNALANKLEDKTN